MIALLQWCRLTIEGDPIANHEWPHFWMMAIYDDHWPIEFLIRSMIIPCIHCLMASFIKFKRDWWPLESIVSLPLLYPSQLSMEHWPEADTGDCVLVRQKFSCPQMTPNSQQKPGNRTNLVRILFPWKGVHDNRTIHSETLCSILTFSKCSQVCLSFPNSYLSISFHIFPILTWMPCS